MASYVPRLSEAAYSFPYTFGDAKAFCFILPADLRKLQEECDRCLNHSPRLRFVACSSSVMLTFITYSRAAIGTAEEEAPRWFRYNEVAVWMLVAALPPIAIDPFPSARDALCWYFPAIYVDDPFALVGGREVWGFPKMLAEIGMAGRDASPAALTVDVPLLSEEAPSGPASRHPGSQLRLIEARRDAAAAGPTRPWDERGPHLRTLFEEVERFLTPPTLDLGWFATAFRQLPLVCLKQVRDARGRETACHSSLVVLRPKMDHVHGSFMRAGYTVRVAPSAQHRLVEGLGLPTEHRPSPLLSFTLGFDLELGAGRMLWSSSR
jgi:hypothetical protein